MEEKENEGARVKSELTARENDGERASEILDGSAVDGSAAVEKKKRKKKGRPRKPRKLGRPRKEKPPKVPKMPTFKRDKITIDGFRALCEIQCTADEISSVFGVSTPTLRSWVALNFDGRTLGDVMKELSLGGNVSLRRALWSVGLNDRNGKMLEFLAKNILGYSDKSESKTEFEGVPPVLIEVKDCSAVAESSEEEEDGEGEE